MSWQRSWKKKVTQVLLIKVEGMDQFENQKQWIQAVESEFEQQKKLWPKEKNHHQKIRELQLKHFSLFLKTGFPSAKDPYWKFNNTNSLLKREPQKINFTTLEENIENSFSSLFPMSYKIEFHNGILKEDSLKNLPEGVQLCTWKNLTPDFPLWNRIINQNALKNTEDGFYYLAGALPTNGYILYIPKNCKISKNIHIHFSFNGSTDTDTSSLSLSNLRNFIFLEEGAEVTLIESTHSQRNITINSSTSVETGSNSYLRWLNLDQGNAHSLYLNQVECKMKESSFIDRLSLSLGSGLSRDIVKIDQKEKAKSILSGLTLLKHNNRRDQRFFVHHSEKEGYSRQISRGILNDKSKNIFHGKIYVSPTAYQTDCAQSAKNLLLSSTADAFTQPELEIHCGEVKAQHGATAGQINKDEMFYLQTRGLEEKKAFELLLTSYMADALNLFSDPDLVGQLMKNIQKNKSLYLNL